MDITDISTLHAGAAESALKNGASRKTGDAHELKEASEQFEAILIRQYLSEAMKPMFEGSMMGESSGSHMYQYMITDVLASELSNNSTFGVASLLQMQLGSPAAADNQSTPVRKINEK
jgi:Rod binding domain-containing protein